MSAIANHSRCRSTHGFIIVAALWIIVALAMLSSIYAIYLNHTKHSFAANDDRVRSQSIISTSLALTAHQLLSRPQEDAPSRGRFNFRLGPANVSADFVSEAARIDLNVAPAELLAGLFIALGASNDAATLYAERIMEWRTPPRSQRDQRNQRNNDGSVQERNAGPARDPRQAAFLSISELWHVPDVPYEMIERAMPYVTIFSGERGIDLLHAPPPVIAALPGMTAEQIQAILDQRVAAPQDEQAITALLTPSQREFVSSKSTAMRTAIHIHFDNGRKVEAEGVIKLTEGKRTPYQVLFWRDDLDIPSSDEGAAGVLQ